MPLRNLLRSTSASLPRVVVFRTGHLGDTVCAIPAFRLLRKHYGHSHLTLLCDYPAGGKVPAWDVIERLELFDSVVAYESGKGWRTWYELYSLVRQLRPHTVVQLPQVDRSARGFRQQRMFFRLAGVPRLIGFRPMVCHHEWHPNEPTRLIQFLNAEGIAGTKPDYAIPISQSALLSVKSKMHELGLDLEKPYVVFCGGGKTPVQRWPWERYRNVLAELQRRTMLPVVAVGSPAEVEDYERFLKPQLPQLTILSPLAMTELTELLRFALLYLGNDTGPMHVAAAVGCAVAAIISARNKPGRWDPDIEPRTIIRHRVPCEGCRLDECVREQHRCLLEITAAQVIDKVVPFAQSLLALEMETGVRPHDSRVCY